SGRRLAAWTYSRPLRFSILDSIRAVLTDHASSWRSNRPTPATTRRYRSHQGNDGSNLAVTRTAAVIAVSLNCWLANTWSASTPRRDQSPTACGMVAAFTWPGTRGLHQ